MNPRPAKHRFWRLCRIYFRRFRIGVWFVLLLVLGAALYVNQIGLPGFIKRPVLERLRAHGLDLQFSRLRVRWYEGIVAEDVRFGSAEQPLSPQLTLREVRVPLNFRALLHLRVQVDALVLRQGRLVWPLAQTNQGPPDLAVEQIQTDLRFLPDDQWELDNFRAVFAGAQISLSGVVTNASAVRDWSFLKSGQAAHTSTGAWQRRLQRLAETLQRIQFSAPPNLRLDVRGDARDLRSFSARLLVDAPGAITPWGTLDHGQFTGRVVPADAKQASHAEFRVEAAAAQTRWGDITNCVLKVQLRPAEGQTNLVNGVLRLSAEQVQTRWAAASNAVLSLDWVHNLTNPVPLVGECRWQCADARTEWGRADSVRLTARFAPPPIPQPNCDESWAWWTNLQPYQLAWDARLSGIESRELRADELACAGNWLAPLLQVTNFQARLYGGRLSGTADLDVATRALRADAATDFDPHQIEPLLNPAGRDWLEQFAWTQPPQARAEVALVLPAWTNREPDWRGVVQPTVRLAGEFRLDQAGTYFGPPREPGTARPALSFSSARSHFIYSNLCWHLPDLTITRPEGTLSAEHRADERTKDFYWRLASTLDPAQLRPFLEPDQQKAFDLFHLTRPPAIEAEIWGRFHEPDRAGFRGRVAVTNFTFREDAFSRLQTSFAYTNRVLKFFGPRIYCGEREARADGLTADFNRELVFLTNGYSTVAPMLIARAVGPHIERAIDDYQFLEPPTAHVSGTIPMRGEADADLNFDLRGGPFHWWKFSMPFITGGVHWTGETLVLTNIQADLYGGVASGSAVFDFRPRGADFRFAATATNLLFPSLIAALSGQTNTLDGRLSGNLFVTAANTEDWQTANGHGDLNLRDGLLWDIPVFGIFSPVLNGIVPGLGNSRATAAQCAFVLTNGVCRTDNLVIRSSAMRLDYRGTVDLAGQVNARVEAALLRNMWLVGPLVSTIFWPVTKMFEYKVTGPLAQPKMDPVFIIPRLVLFPFHPIRTIKDLVPNDAPPGQTNGPPLFGPPPK